MSRAFVREDADHEPEPRFSLPEADSPRYDEAAAWALMEGANMGHTRSAELATGYRWGEPRLTIEVQRIQEKAQRDGDERLVQLATRFLRAVHEGGA